MSRRDADAEITNYTVAEGAEEELREVRRLLEANPENTEVREWLAFRQYTAGRYPDAILNYLELVRRGHRPGSQYFHLGNAYYKMNKHAEAVAAWRKTIELLPDDPKAKKARARIEKAQAG